MNAVALLSIIHVLISLVGLVAGFVLIAGLLQGRLLETWNKLFLVTTIATSASGFLFPATHVTPGHVIGVISLAVLAAAFVARYQQQRRGRWRPAFVLSALSAQYLNFFVLIVQLFLKVPALKALAPNGSGPIFAAAHLVALAAFVAVAVVAMRRFRQADERPHADTKVSLAAAAK